MYCIRKDIVRILVLLFFLLSANIYTLFFVDSLFDTAVDRLWYIAVMAIGYIVGLLLLKPRTFFIVAGVAQMLVLPIEVSSLYLNGAPVSAPFMHWIIGTNCGEAGELLQSVWWLVLVTVIIWCVYGWLVAGIRQEKIVEGRGKRILWGVAGLMMTAALLIQFIQLNSVYTAPNKRVYARIYAWSFLTRAGSVFPYDIYLQTFRAFKHRQEIDGISSLSDYQFGISPRIDADSTLCVLVIGEAARYQNFSLNGEYARETNPLLAQQSNLILYTQAYSEANATDMSVPLMITRATADDPGRAYQEKTVSGAFQEAGYKAAWLSAESAPIRYLQHVLPTLDSVWIAPDEVLDEALLEPFEGVIRDNTTSSLIILHTKGSHLNYQDRYPESFALFEPCLKKGATTNSFDKERMTNTYDNSIVYTDFVLHSLIQILDRTHRCACMLYMPDHGENLCDDARKLWVHGSYDGTEWEYHVPLLVWYSDAFQQKYPAKVAALNANKDKQVTSQVLFYTLCDVAGLDEVVDPRHSLLSDSLEEESSLRIINGKGELIDAAFGKNSYDGER